MAQAVGPYTIEMLEQFPADVIFDRHTLLEPDLLVVLAEGARQFRPRAFSPLLATL